MSIPQSITQNVFYKHPNYWVLNGSGYFVELGRKDCLTIIKRRCIAIRHAGDSKEAEIIIAWIAENQSIDKIYPYLPGYPVGVIPGTKILVPTALKPIEPEPGDCDLVEGILLELLGPKQLEYCYGWLKISDECFRAHNTMPGQVIVLAGPQHAGKNFVQEHIFTPILGSQAADPYRFIIGRTEFNAHLYRAIHLMMSDQKNPRNREDLREFFRDVASNESGLLHAKNKDAGTVKTLRRMTISCNLTEKDLAIVPPLDGLEDKVMLFKCELVTMPLPGDEPAQREARAAAVEAQLPAFVDRLHHHKIRTDLRHPRFGIKGFLHPEIAKMVRELDKEQEFLELIIEGKRKSSGWDLTDRDAGDIYSELHAVDYLRDGLRKCCGSGPVAGKLLTALAGRNDGIVTGKKQSARRVTYTIKV
jgi:hypothetical protein